MDLQPRTLFLAFFMLSVKMPKYFPMGWNACSDNRLWVLGRDVKWANSHSHSFKVPVD